MMVLSYIPCIQATQPPNERVRRGAVGVGQQTGSKSSLPPCPRIASGPWRPRKGRPRPFAEDRGLSAEWGERGWGLGGTPTRHEPTERGGANTVPAWIFSSLRRGAARAPQCIVNPSDWLPFRVRGHPGKG